MTQTQESYGQIAWWVFVGFMASLALLAIDNVIIFIIK